MRKTTPFTAAALCGAALLCAPLAAAPGDAYTGPNSGDWNTAAYWNANVVPNGNDGNYYDVTNASANTVVHSASSGTNGVDTINSLSFSGAGGLTLSGGILAGAQASQGSAFSVSGTLLLSGGELRNFTLAHSDLAQFSANLGNILDNVTLDGGLNLASGGTAVVTGSFAHGAGATFALGAGSGLYFGANVTLDNATVNFNAPTSGSLGTLGTSGTSTLTLGPHLTVSGKFGAISASTLVNQTTIGPDIAGIWNIGVTGTFTNSGLVNTYNSTLNETGGTLGNTGTIEATGAGRVTLTPTAYSGLGTITADGLGAQLTLAGGTIRLAGTETLRGINGGTLALQTTLDNTGRTFDPAAVGNFQLDYGTIKGGTIVHSGSLQFYSGSLQDVTLDGGLNIGSGQAYIAGSFTPGAGAVFAVGSNGTLQFNNTITLDNVTVSLGAGSQTGFLECGGDLTFGPSFTLAGANADVLAGDNYLTTGAFTNNATLHKTLPGEWYIQSSGGLVNNGTINADNGSTVSAGGTNGQNTAAFALTNTGTLEAVGGGTFFFDFGTLNNTGVIEALTGGTFSLGPTAFGHLGTVHADGAGSNVILSNGSLTPALLAQTTATNGGIITLETTLDAGGGVFDPLSLGPVGSLIVNGGLIENGSLTNSSAVGFLNNNNAGGLQNVALDGGLNIGSSTSATPGYVISRGTLTHPDGAVFNLYNASTLAFGNDYTLDHATVNFLVGANVAYLKNDSSTTLTLGPSLVLTGKYASFTDTYIGGASASLVNQTTLSSNLGGSWSLTPTGNLTNTGLIEARNAVSSLLIHPQGSLANTGTIQAVGGGQVTINLPSYTGSTLGTVTASGTGSSVSLTGGTLTLGQGEHLSATSGGLIRLSTTLNNTGKTFDPLAYGAAGAFALGGGTISGGTIAHSDSLGFTGGFNTFTNVTLDGGLSLANAPATVYVSGTFAHGTGATFDLGTASSLQFAGASLLDNVILKFGGSAAALTFSGATFTLGRNLVMQGGQGVISSSATAGGTLVNQTSLVASGLQGTTRGTFSLQVGTVTNQGTLGASGGGSLVVSNGAVFTSTGTVSVTSGSLMSAPNFSQTAGQTIVDGNLTVNVRLGTGTSIGTLTVQGGTLSGTGTVTGAVSNPSGILSPGDSTGTLTISSAYTQNGQATFLEQLGGIGAGQFDVLQVGGAASLAGALDVALVSGFTPAVGQSFTFLNYGSKTGAFSTIVAMDPGYSYSVAYGPNASTLTVTAAPEPSAWLSLALGGAGLLGLGWKARKRVA